MKNFRSIRFFLGLTALVLTVTVAAEVVVAVILKASFSAADLGNIGTVLQGTLGVAASFAGSLVAIKIASVANSMVEVQAYRETFDLLSEKLEEAINTLRHAASCLTRMYAAQVCTEKACSDAISDIKSRGSSNLNETVEIPEMDEFIFAFIAFLEALRKVTDNPYAHYIWRELGRKRMSQFRTVHISEDVGTLNVQSDLSEIWILLKVRANLLAADGKKVAISKLFADRLTADALSTGAGSKINDSSVRSLLWMGARIWTRPDGNRIRNFGVSFIVDMINCFPRDILELKECIKTILPAEIADRAIIERLPILKVHADISPESLFGISFNRAIEGYREKSIEPDIELQA